jgi:hypothetical protein
MTIYRGPGGTGEARTDSDVTEVRIIADEAEGYKNDAAASASAAASSASAATTAETNAETAEANAETAEANAEAAQAAAEDAQAAAEAAQASAVAVYDAFDSRYLGAKSSDPTVDNDGDALIEGALYFNTTDSDMRVYTGSAWTSLAASSSGVTSFNTRTGDVTLTDTDVNTALGYTAANSSLVALKANNLSDLASASAARTNLGLGTAATTASTAYATAAQGTNADTAYGWGNHASAGYAADNAVVKLTGDQTVGGTKTFSSPIAGSVSGNAGTATALATGRTISSTGDVAYTSASFDGSSNVTGTATLATVNSNVGSFGSSTAIPVVTVNAKGLVTAVSTATVAGGQYFGSASVKAIAYNSQTIGENVTVTTGNNGLSAGPITISNGFTVTVESGAYWTIV